MKVSNLTASDIFQNIYFPLALDEDELPDFSAEDPHDVALLLVRYLTDLPEPLCTFVMYDDFVRCEGKFVII